MNLADKLDMLREQNPQSSQAEIVAMLGDDERAVLFDGFTDEDFEKLEYDPDFWLRPKQKIYEDDNWSRTLLVAGRGFGKLCDIDHILPTPDGWKKLGDIQDGDKLFDEQGNICTVVKAHPVQLPKKAYKLTFSDGTSITAGEEHLWTTWTHSARKSYNRRNEYNHVDDSIGIPDDWPTWEKIGRWGKPTGIGPKTITTQEIVDTFRHGKRGDLNHSIPVTAPLQYPEKDLPIDPYLFGVHLGDGGHSTSQITIHKDEHEWMRTFLASRGHNVSEYRASKEATKNAGNFTVFGLSGLLGSIGSASKEKIIPREYLEGSEQQRRDLLAGLLDTDGYVDPSNQQIEFCAKRRHHADAVMELARSLGQKPTLYVGRATLNGKDYGEKYRVMWRPTDNFFYMPRKRAIFQMPEAQASRNYHRMIVSFEEVPVVPMRCLTVDSPNHLFLIGEGMIPTHNTLTVSHWLRKKAIENPGSYAFLAGRTVADVRNILVNGESGILAISPESERPEYKSHTASLHWPNGTTALLLSSEAPDGARGPQAHFAVCDEVAAWKTTPDSSGATLYDNIIAATRLGKNPQIVMATTPKRTEFMRDRLEEASNPERRIKVVRGSTFENRSLSDEYIEGFKASYGDSDLAKQELMGEMLDDAEGIVFTDEIIKKALDYDGYMPALHKIIAVDPSVADDPSKNKTDECGIMVMGVTKESDIRKRKVYLIDDISIRASPEQWSKHIVEKAREHGIVDIVAEQNQGYGLIKAVLNAEDSNLRVHLVHAKRNKITRAEPVVVAMDNGRVKMIEEFPTLTDQLLYYDPNMKKSPDRMDALVWGVTALIIDPPPTMRMGTLHIARTPNLSIPQRLDRQAGLLIPRNIRY